MPKRIQLKRTKGWRKPKGSIVVSRPSKWGNPFVVGSTARVPAVWMGGIVTCLENKDMLLMPETREQSVAMYRLMMLFLTSELSDEPIDLSPLRGKDLCCWCPLDRPCHADVLLELANKEQ